MARMGQSGTACGFQTEKEHSTVSNSENPTRWEADGNLFAAAFEHTPVMMTISAQDNDILLEVNDEFERVSGYSREEALGKSAVELGLITAEELARVSETVGAGGHAMGVEMAFRARNGVQRRCLTSMVPVRIGGIPRMLALGIDVTGNTRHEGERGLTLELLGLLNAPSGLQEMMDGTTRLLQRFTRCDAVAVRLREDSDFPLYSNCGLRDDFLRVESHLCTGPAGSGLDCLCGATLTDTFKPGLETVTAYGSFWTNSMGDLMRGPLAQYLPDRIRGGCLREGYESVALIPLRFAGRTLGLMQFDFAKRGSITPEWVEFLERSADSIATAIEQRQTQAALQASEKLLRESQRASHIGSYALDMACWKWTSTTTLDEIFGIGPDYAKTLASWLEIIHPDDRQDMNDYFRQEVVGRRRPFDIEYRILRQTDKQVRWVHGRGELIRNAKDELVTMAGTVQDITERKRLEGELLQAQKMESVGRLAGGVAHDFNNLLMVINGYCDLMLEGMSASNPLKEQLDEVRGAGERAAALTQQLLAFSRRQVMRPQVLELNSFLQETERLLQRLIGEDVRLVTILDPSLGKVKADAGQLNQVILNLAVNARDAMPGGGRLTIETANVEIDADGAAIHPGVRAGRFVRLAVSDTGAGLDPEARRHLFEPFFTTKPAGHGTGLGLSSVYGIVQQSGGWISVYSEEGAGTQFHVYLPRVEDQEEVVAVTVDAPQQATGTETILIAEDQDNVRRLTSRVLRSFGYRVLEAATGPEALALAEAHDGPIHLLVTDVVMPEMSGHELSLNLQRHRPSVRVLYMSGYTGNVIARHGLLEDGVAFIQKPFTAAALAAKVREALRVTHAPSTILVADDDAAVRSLFRMFLEHAGYRVMEAADGVEAVAAVKQGCVDLIIADLVMPEKEGIETIVEIHKNFPSVKIAAVSGAFDGGFLQVASMLGAGAALSKPVSEERLLATVGELLGQS
jgi:PAS domain S-box-containing protein